MKTWLRGLALLRFPELVHDLGERRLHLLRVNDMRRACAEARIDSDVRLVDYEAGRLELARDVQICGGTVLAFGDSVNGFGRIVVGERTWIGQYNNLRAGGGDISIGRHCLVSQFCTLVASNHAISHDRRITEQGPDPTRRGVTLGDDVWLGSGVTVTPGITICTGAVIGAGAVVTRDVPTYEIWGGVPARKLGERA